MFIDRARVFVKAGDGGDGMSSFRREKYVPNGGPSGGDGGKGADVIFKADKNINTLVDFRYKRQFKAPAGGNGESSNKHGRGSEPLIIPVPLGTVIKEEETGKFSVISLTMAIYLLLLKVVVGAVVMHVSKQVLTVHRHLQKRVNLVKSSGYN